MLNLLAPGSWTTLRTVRNKVVVYKPPGYGIVLWQPEWSERVLKLSNNLSSHGLWKNYPTKPVWWLTLRSLHSCTLDSLRAVFSFRGGQWLFRPKEITRERNGESTKDLMSLNWDLSGVSFHGLLPPYPAPAQLKWVLGCVTWRPSFSMQSCNRTCLWVDRMLGNRWKG
jgi:hypothetical protein